MIWVLIVAIHASSASQTNKILKINAVKTKVIDGYYIGLLGMDSYSTNNTSPDDKILVFTWTTNKPTWVTVPVESEYAYQIELLDSKGVPVPKTRLGKIVGSRFYEFNSASSKKGVATKQLFVKPIGEQAGAPLLFYPHKTKDFFKINKPGDYMDPTIQPI